MAGNECDLVPQREETLAYRGEQGCVIAAGKISAADPALEKNITDERSGRFGVKKYHVTRCVPWTVDDLQGDIAHVHLFAVDQPMVGFERLRGRKTEHRCLLGQYLEPEPVFDVGTDDRHPFGGGQFPRRAHVIEMRVCQKDLFQYNLFTDERLA